MYLRLKQGGGRCVCGIACRFEEPDEHYTVYIDYYESALWKAYQAKITQGGTREMELLILAASLHDLGMVYTDDEKQRYFEDMETCRKKTSANDVL